jgi:tetratricopeptide (TPR) repeat protein
MNCGQQLPDVARFCMNCGTATMNDVSDLPREAIAQQVTEVPTQINTRDASIEANDVPLEEQIRNLVEEAFDHLTGFQGKNDKSEALRLLNQAIELDKNNSELYVKKAFALRQCQRYEDALEAYEQALKLGNSPTATFDVKADALAGKGSMLAELRRYEEALVAINESIKINYRDFAVHSTKSLILRRLGHVDEANEESGISEALYERFMEEYDKKGEELKKRAREGNN